LWSIDWILFLFERKKRVDEDEDEDEDEVVYVVDDGAGAVRVDQLGGDCRRVAGLEWLDAWEAFG